MTFLSDVKKKGPKNGPWSVCKSKYDEIGDTYTTNESAVRYLLKKGWNEKPIQLERIFAFASNTVLENKVGLNMSISPNTDIDQYGITIEIAEIKALDLPDDNKAAVYSRMISERENIAAGYTAQGNAEAQKVKNDTDKQVSINIADAKAKAAVIRAQGEAEYMKILSAAYNDPDKAAFYNYLRGLDSMEALARSKAVIILDKDSEYAKILYGQ